MEQYKQELTKLVSGDEINQIDTIIMFIETTLLTNIQDILEFMNIIYMKNILDSNYTADENFEFYLDKIE